MTQYLLAAVAHQVNRDINDRLMCEESMQLFRERVEPLITENSLVLAEGFMHPTLLSSDHARYDELNTSVIRLPGTVRPTFGGFDTRQQKLKTIGDFHDLGERGDKWQIAVERCIECKAYEIPGSLEGVISSFREGIPRATLKQTPTSEEINLARWIAAENRRFDRAYLDAMRKHGRRFNLCVFVGGAMHVVAMALTSGYPVADLVPKDELQDVCEVYLADYEWSRLFLKAGYRR